MRIKRLILQNFRNFENLDISFSNNGAFFFGRNGMGKTNILEAIYLLGYFKSFRSSVNEHVIHYNKETALINAYFEDESGLENHISLEIKKKQRMFFK